MTTDQEAVELERKTNESIDSAIVNLKAALSLGWGDKKYNRLVSAILDIDDAMDHHEDEFPEEDTDD